MRILSIIQNNNYITNFKKNANFIENETKLRTSLKLLSFTEKSVDKILIDFINIYL